MSDAALDTHRGVCRSCGAPVLWAVTNKGETMPVNATPDYRGNVILSAMGGVLHAGVLGRNQAAGAHDRGELLYTSHFADCPNASKHRRTR